MRPLFLLAAMPMLVAPASAQSDSSRRDHGVTVQIDGQPIKQGSGRHVRQSRPAGAFHTIELKGAANLEVVTGDPSIEIEADDNLLDNITTRIEGGTLIVATTGSYSTKRAPVVRVSLDELRAIEASGSGDVQIHALRGGDLSLTGMGSGDFRADGTVASLRLKLQGSGNAEFSRLKAENAVVTVNGSGYARIHAEHSLDASANGSGDIVYDGPAEKIRLSVNGSAQIRKFDTP
ncbi:MAG: DUF2807 domain-containing protein [Sphingomonas sp.]|uniref:head GIN domain-containing protein n=1 Tax=Sphingomonas sp. TaxID=28214 RepID=UPI0025EB3F93|nr:head GIN domain-containing protein [Sphingomonas sp.]MBX3564100.1 DUF2807 domain-containing protein [Sphingomonas sp.]